ncbi:MAG TPA: thiamine pyrophosphate-dependent enzyme [Phycisphaerae bacterium]|nr:thiamine pyrophosphate-dependent enzyme [Phycisphaerae bacterium]HRY67254.1 thiamine pyrophosphate-dependent enzyme [Phycisphaerae bacterium]HSA26376.1 thiamine pyrophosphate-dependent enzyme [Phycisphaerae bacterium]
MSPVVLESQSTEALRGHETTRRETDRVATPSDASQRPNAADTPPSDGLLDDLDRRLVRQALTIRRTEERLLSLFAEGKLFGTVHTCIGQEWIGVAVANALQSGDAIFTNHRGHGHYLARTGDVEGLIAELMGRTTGVCGGRGGSQHLCRESFYSNGIQGGIVPVAAGLAMARKLIASGTIAAVFIGDGTLGEGAVYETLNIAAKWSLPLLIVIEDNGVSQSTDQSQTLAGTVAGRAQAFGMDVRLADTWHPAELIHQAALAADQVRRSGQPLILHVHTYRLKAHSKGDDERDPAAVAAYAQRDTLNRLIAQNSLETRQTLAAIDQRIEQAVARASIDPCTTVEITTLTRPAIAAGGRSPAHACSWKPVDFQPQRAVDAIRSALGDAMAADERIVLLGEDIRDPYGGAFKVTAGLSTRFDGRVFNTPISEAAITGLGNGLALAGRHPVVEIMFGDFLLLAADQFVNHAAKFAGMYDDQVTVPLVIRTPSGGYRGYGPTHSQCLEKHLLGVPGTRVLALHKRYCPGILYHTLLAVLDRPTLVIENKTLYGRRTDPAPPADCTIAATDSPFPTVRLRPNGPRQITLVAYGGMVEIAETAMIALRQQEELSGDLLIPAQLYPLDIEPIVESAGETGNVLVIEEGQGFAGFGAELIAQLASDPRLAGLRAARVHAADCTIPSSKPAELQVLPAVDRVVGQAVRLITS